jgi:hypothetical protein
MFHTLIRQASIVTGSGVAPFTGDIGVTATRRVRMVDGQRRVSLAMGIEDLGDLRVFSGLEEIDARGMVVAPLFAPNLVEGTEIKIPAGLKVDRPLGAGQPAALVLLQPGSIPGNYRILRIVKGD